MNKSFIIFLFGIIIGILLIKCFGCLTQPIKNSALTNPASW